VAATIWLRDAGIEPVQYRDWSGQWLHWSRRDEDPEEEKVPEALWGRIRAARANSKPPAYYAILMLDGDHLGKWLRGEKAPAVREALHPKLVDYFRALPGTESGLEARRPFGPAMHAALSEALTNFALHFVPNIVKEHQGTLIYAGGDDVLALLPTEKAMACASALACVYRKEWAADDDNQTRLLMGSRATLSAGLAVVHYKEDLRVALRAAREAEKQAKNAGRNCLCARVVRRSGEDSSAVVGWDQVAELQNLVASFQDSTSDRWAYHLRGELDTFALLPTAAFEAELGRLLGRMEGGTDDFRDRVMHFWQDYQTRWSDSPAVRADVVTLYQSASFLARGRDQ
jgi:CRISPR-associated protein Cmr2